MFFKKGICLLNNNILLIETQNNPVHLIVFAILG